ncbi:MAG: carbonic anhydrase [Acidaminococcaceae bacterium]
MKKNMLKKILSATLLALSLTALPTTYDLASAAAKEKTSTVYTRTAIVTSPAEARNLLIEGNTRFSQGKVFAKDFSLEKRTDLSVNGQKPFAVIVSCSDSRIPPELVFDQALGDLFVIRVAGNVVDAIEMGSIEYAVEHLGSPLVVVLGHEKCGAVKASVDGGEVTENIAKIAAKIQPAIDNVKAQDKSATGGKIYNEVETENVKLVQDTINANPIMQHLIHQNKVEVIGAKYHLESGTVTFFN